jgi:threonylcarbamoyladenosine tRNA methylthiotransferase MtaB
MKKIAFKALGCRLNQFEIESLATAFSDAGYEVVPFEGKADAYILNTCTVTNKSDQKSRNMISKTLRNKGGEGISVVTGCFATSNQRALEESYGIDYIVNNEKKAGIFDLLDAHFNGEMPQVEDIKTDLFHYPASRKIFRTRGMVKIQDGCDNFCSFCIIPFVRGRAVSRPQEEVLDSVRAALDEGFKEITLTGVNIGRYAHGEIGFSSLVESILALDDSFRLRISSIEPDPLDDRFIDLLSHPQLCPHLHICLQSGSEKVLLRMRRAYSFSQYAGLVGKIRAKRPDCNLTTDIMVGFPGEEEADFQQTLQAVSDIGFSHVHTFRYSRRKGTKAERYPDQVPEKVKSERSHRLQDVVLANKETYYRSFIGKTQDILVEHALEDGHQKITGYGEHYVPVVVTEGEGASEKENSLIPVRISGMGTHQGEPVLKADGVLSQSA